MFELTCSMRGLNLAICIIWDVKPIDNGQALFCFTFACPYFRKSHYIRHTYFFLGDEDYIILSLDGAGEGILFNTVSGLENCLEVNNANCDLGMMGDLNMMEHLDQTTEAPLLANKARENEEHNETLRERWRTYGRNWRWHRQMWLWWVKRKIMREKKLIRKMNKCLILSASITGENVLHYKHMERNVLALSTRVPLVSRLKHDERKLILKECSHQQKCKASEWSFWCEEVSSEASFNIWKQKKLTWKD